MDDDMMLWVFQREVSWQCQFALMAADDLQTALHAGDTGRSWYSVHALLVAAANLSKLLWPSERDRVDNERRATLRDSLGIDDDSPIASRDFRNSFEHFDEKLE